jgi:Kef-type K+ transport system membrane component KefB
MVIGVTAGTALEFLHDAREWPLLGGLAVVMMIATVVLATAVPRLFRRGRERAAIALGASAEITLWCAFLIAPAVRPTGSRELRLWFLAMVVVVMAATYLPLLRKLGTRRAST